MLERQPGALSVPPPGNPRSPAPQEPGPKYPHTGRSSAGHRFGSHHMTTNSEHAAAPEDAGFIAGELGERMGIELTGASPDRVEGRMPVEGNRQPFGLLHGGASCVLAETLGSTGAFLHAEKLGKLSAGIESNATDH